MPNQRSLRTRARRPLARASSPFQPAGHRSGEGSQSALDQLLLDPMRKAADAAAGDALRRHPMN